MVDVRSDQTPSPPASIKYLNLDYSFSSGNGPFTDKLPLPRFGGEDEEKADSRSLGAMPLNYSYISAEVYYWIIRKETEYGYISFLDYSSLISIRREAIVSVTIISLPAGMSFLFILGNKITIFHCPILLPTLICFNKN